MLITLEFIQQGATSGIGFSRRHIELLGGDWPLTKGWKARLVGREISEDAAKEYLMLAAPKPDLEPQPEEGDQQIWLYVLELVQGKRYVGITTTTERRLRQHINGVAAGWTVLHPVVRLAYAVKTGATSHRAAEVIEDQATVELMMRMGVDNVRGGHFCSIAPDAVAHELRAHGHWDALQLGHLKQQGDESQLDWANDLQRFADSVIEFHAGDGGAQLEAEVFKAGLRLTRSQYWRDSYAPSLGSDFWGRKGVLPVLLTFQQDRPIGSGLSWPYEVLQAALQRGSNGRRPFAWLFLAAWEIFSPSMTDHQAAAAAKLLAMDRFETHRDQIFDEFISVLLPQMRYRLRTS